MISANIAVALGKRGWKVLLVDFDLGGSNLHTLLNFGFPGKSLSDFIEKKDTKLDEVKFYLNDLSIDFIPGMVNSVPDASLKVVQRNKLIRHLKKLDYDFIIIDLGAGISPSVLDFFNIDEGVIVGVPQPTSVENIYRFARSVLVRKLLLYKAGSRWKNEVKTYLNIGKTFYKDDLDKFLLFVKSNYKDEFDGINNLINDFSPSFILNMLSDVDLEMSEQIRIVFKKLLGIDIKILGGLPFDMEVANELKNKKLTYFERPKSLFSRGIVEISDKIVGNDGKLL